MIKRLVFLATMACMLTACGNKGALVMPDAKPADAAPAPAPQPAAPAVDNDTPTPG